MRCISLILFSAIALCQAALSDTNEIAFQSREGLLWIKARTQSGEPLNLLLDTGASVSVLNTAAADYLGLSLGRRIVLRGVEATLTGHSLKPVTLTAQGLQLPAPALAVDLGALSCACKEPVDGLLGADFFRSRIVEIDFVTHKLRILSDNPSPQHSDTIPLQFRPCGMRVPVSVNGRKLQWVRLDTGCASDLQWVTSTVRAEDCMMRKTAVGLACVSIPQTETTLQVGPYTFQNVPTGLHDKPIFQGEAGLLGNGLLSRFSKITLDTKSRRLILESRPE